MKKTQKKILKVLLISIFVFTLCASILGTYLLLNLYSYHELTASEVQDKIDDYTNNVFESEKIGNDLRQDYQGDSLGFIFAYSNARLIIPKIGTDLGIFSGSEQVLEKGIWHRHPDRGNPLTGGNFILSGHRFGIGYSAENIKRASPLFHLDKIELGDEIIIIWDREVFYYDVVSITRVPKEQTEIESRSSEAILTLYTCTPEGAADGREVIVAVPRG